MSNNNLDFDDKVQLTHEIINTRYAASIKSQASDEIPGKIVEDFLNDGAYDTETIIDDLKDLNDSSIMDGIEENLKRSKKVWNDAIKQIFYETLNNIFAKNITDYEQLCAADGSNQMTDDSKETKYETENKAEAQPVHRYVSSENAQRQRSDNRRRLLATDTEENAILDKIDDRRWYEIVSNAICETNTQIADGFSKIELETVIAFFQSEIDKNKFKYFNKKTFAEMLDSYMKKGAAQKLFKQIKDGIKIRKLTDLSDGQFYFIVEHGINKINRENEGKFKQINCAEILEFLREIELNGQRFVLEFTKKKFQNEIGERISKGTTNKIYKYLTKQCDIESTLREMPESIPGEIEQKSDNLMVQSRPQRFEEKGNVNNQISKPKKGSIVQTFEEKERPKIDLSSECDSVLKLSECTMMQLRYALLFVIIGYNREKAVKYPQKTEKQIPNMDEIIHFLCFKEKFDGRKLAELGWDNSRKKADFAYLLFNQCRVLHKPGKKILEGLQNFSFQLMPTFTLDLELPFLFKQGIIKLKIKNTFAVLWSLRYKTYAFVQDRKGFVEFLKNDCGVARGPSIKLRKFVREFVQNNGIKIETEPITATVTESAQTKSVPTLVKPQKIITKPMSSKHPILEIMIKYRGIRQCSVKDFKEIMKCCVGVSNIQNNSNIDFDKLWTDLNDRINRKQRKTMVSLQECNNALFVRIAEKCIAKFVNRGIFKRDSATSLAFAANQRIFLKYLSEMGVDGSNFEKKFAKKSKFAKICAEACFAKKLKGIKSELMKVYVEIKGFDCTHLETEEKEQSGQELNGNVFLNCFQTKQDFLNNNGSLADLYGLMVEGFFEWNRNASNNRKYFQSLLLLFAVYKYHKTSLNLERLQELNGNKFVNDSQFSENMFCERLGNDEIASHIYKDMMALNLKSKNIQHCSQCTHNELLYFMKLSILPQFNRNKREQFKLNVSAMTEALVDSTELNGHNVNAQNRKSFADKLNAHCNDLKIGPLRKLASNIHKYDIIL